MREDFKHAGFKLGLILVALIAVFIAMDLLGYTRQAQEAHWIGKHSEITRVEVCRGLSVPLITEAARAWEDHCWPTLPEPVVVDCEVYHIPAEPGVLRWHGCDSMRMEYDPVVPCPLLGPPKNGATFAQVADGRVVAADVYLRDGAPDHTAVHEIGHVRGYIVTEEEDDATPHVHGAHTEFLGHVMSEQGGTSWRWLDRCEE